MSAIFLLNAKTHHLHDLKANQMKLSLHLTDDQSAKLDRLSGLRNLQGASPRACRSTVLRELINRAAAEELPSLVTTQKR